MRNKRENLKKTNRIFDNEEIGDSKQLREPERCRRAYQTKRFNTVVTIPSNGNNNVVV